MAGGVDPYEVLGVKHGADQAEIHAAYRAAVRRTHPDAGGTAAAFEAVQEAYEELRGGAPRQRTGARPAPPKPPRRPAAADRDGVAGSPTSGMDALLAESRRLEDEARRLADLPPRQRDGEDPDSGGAGGTTDSVGAILRDAGEQLREAADSGARELRRRLRRIL